jgi:hypothetical protein
MMKKKKMLKIPVRKLLQKLYDNKSHIEIPTLRLPCSDCSRTEGLEKKIRVKRTKKRLEA